MLDLDEFDALHLADQRLPQVAERATELSRERLEQRVALLVGAARVDERGDLPVAGEHVPRDVADEDEIQPRDVDVADLPSLDPVRHDRVARAEVWVLADPARTVDV